MATNSYSVKPPESESTTGLPRRDTHAVDARHDVGVPPEDFPQPSYDPLASHHVFKRWAAASPWSAGTIAFGGVVDPLVDGVAEFARRPRKDTYRRWEHSAAVGCVPWMNNERMTAALASVDFTCIVTHKGASDRRAAEVLQAQGNPIPIVYLPGFDDMAKPEPDGRRPIVVPSGLVGETVEQLGPVRAAGWRGDRRAPLLHAKLLVLGDAVGWDSDEFPDWGVHFRFKPQLAWLGSANWTKGATQHLEFGLWTTDPSLVDYTFQFVLDVIRFSEPFDTTTDHPEPELVDAEWDEGAFREAAAEMALDHWQDEADEL